MISGLAEMNSSPKTVGWVGVLLESAHWLMFYLLSLIESQSDIYPFMKPDRCPGAFTLG